MKQIKKKFINYFKFQIKIKMVILHKMIYYHQIF